MEEDDIFTISNFGAKKPGLASGSITAAISLVLFYFLTPQSSDVNLPGQGAVFNILKLFISKIPVDKISSRSALIAFVFIGLIYSIVQAFAATLLARYV